MKLTVNSKQFIVNSSAFTLIELLVVVALIGILSTLLMANFNAARQRSRDAQRKSDLKNIQIALRLYYNDQGYYPESDDDGNIKGCDPGDVVCEWGETWSIGSTDYMSTLPSDPLDSQFYRYIRADLDTYTLSACLENRSDTNCGGNDTWCTTDMGCIYTLKP